MTNISRLSPFAQGPVSALQEMLRIIATFDPAIPFLRPTGRFDEATLEAVMRFQKNNGLAVTGVVDRKSWDAILDAYLRAEERLAPPRAVTVFSPGSLPIYPGQSSYLLRFIQDMFRALSDILENIQPAPSTGVLDAATEANIRWLQSCANLPRDGILDQPTWSILTRLFETFITQRPVRVLNGS